MESSFPWSTFARRPSQAGAPDGARSVNGIAIAVAWLQRWLEPPSRAGA
jgi:hypothetical protein